MTRVAFTMIGGKSWTGGYNYLLNLVRALAEYASERVQPVMFFGNDIEEQEVAPFERIRGVLVCKSAVFNEANKGKRLLRAILTGCDARAALVFAEQDIDVVFESAQFYGWRFPVRAVAWIPDFQHRYLRHLFDFKGYWKREVGFQAQILSGRDVMLSSEDARQDCEHFYPSSRGKTHVVRFAVPVSKNVDNLAARMIADSYGLPESFFFLPNQFWRHKNHECVIQALRILKARGLNLVVAASGKQADPRDLTYFPGLKLMIESNGLTENLKLLGLIPHAHIPALMQCCTALINPSTFEGWSTTVEEAKVIGTPMILSSLRVHREQSDKATFFDPRSPEELADRLEKASINMGMQNFSSREFTSLLEHDRMNIFANKFADLMEHASAR